MAASIEGGRAEAGRGVEFFARLKEAGNLAAPGQPPTAVLDWDFRNAARAAESPGDGPGWKVVIPRGAALGTYYVQAVSKDAPHPAAARLWQEFLLSDRGQNLFLKGFARPVRLEAMRMRGTLDSELAGRLPAAHGEPMVLTVPQSDAAKAYLRREWAGAVGHQ
nr:hypothetical protein GCM10020093_060350 [Planobispora longispora]